MTWLAHVKKTMAEEKGKKEKLGKKWFSHVLKTAKRTYKKGHRRGGAESESDEEPEKMAAGPAAAVDTVTAPTAGRRRRGRKTQRRSRK